MFPPFTAMLFYKEQNYEMAYKDTEVGQKVQLTVFYLHLYFNTFSSIYYIYRAHHFCKAL